MLRICANLNLFSQKGFKGVLNKIHHELVRMLLHYSFCMDFLRWKGEWFFIIQLRGANLDLYGSSA